MVVGVFVAVREDCGLVCLCLFGPGVVQLVGDAALSRIDVSLLF